MSFISAAERLAAIDHSAVKLVTSRCLHARDKFSVCTTCFEICPAGAITAGQPPVLNHAVCQTCLACLPACPTGAYTADDAVPALLNCASRLENNQIELICGRHPAAQQGPEAEATGVQLRGCLAGLGAGAYLSLVALGMERIFVRLDGCEACAWRMLRDQIEIQLSQARQLLHPWGKGPAIVGLAAIQLPVERPLWQADNPPLSRRELFRLAARRGQVAMARALENGHPETERQPNRNRLRILGAILHLPEPAKGQPEPLDTLDFARISIHASCTACAACERFCPTAAIQFEKNGDETTYRLAFTPKLCIGCALCVHVCIPEAISVEHKPTFEQVFETEQVSLRAGALTRCAICKTPFAARANAHLCQPCDYRRKHPFGPIQRSGIQPSLPVEQGENIDDH